MSLRVGDVVLDRFKLLAELPGTADLWRFSAEDQRTGAVVEVVAPTLLAALRPGASPRFFDAPTPLGPARLDRLAEGLEGKLAVAVRPANRGPWPEQIRLKPEQALAVAAWLGPEILEAQPALPDGLRAEDLVLDAAGVPRLAPTALVHGGAIHQPPRHRPPELVAGAEATPESGLYGLGVLLTRAVTGVDAVPGDTVARWAAASPRPARSVLPELNPAVAALLDGLLSADPAARRMAIEALPPGEPVALELPETPSETRARPAPAPTRPNMDARRDVRLGAWVVAVLPEALGEGASRRVAALAGTTAGALRAAGGAGRWVPVGEATRREHAEAFAARLTALGAGARVLSGEPPTALTLGAVALIGLAACVGLVGLLAFFPLLVIALGLGFGGLALGLGASRTRSVQRDLIEARSRMIQVEESSDQVIPRQISESRRLALEADLPDPALQDLLASLDALDEQESAGQLSGPAARATLDQIRAAVASFQVSEAPPDARLAPQLNAMRAAAREVERGG